MVNPQLLQYVRAQRAAGVSKEDIVKALSGGGWTAADAQEAFAAIDAPPPPMQAPKPPPPPPQTPSVSPQLSTMSPAMQARTMPTQVAMAPQPMTVRPQVTPVQPRASAYAAAPRRRSRWPWVLLFLIIFFVLGVGVGAYVTVKYDFIYSMIAPLAGVVEDPAENGEGLNMVANEGDTGGFLEVSPDPFDTTPLDEDNGTSTPNATSTSATSSPQ